jgi:hypothetical protein
MENENEPKKTYSFMSYITAILFLFGLFGGIFYCVSTIYKGIIRQAVIEAIEQTRVKL